MKKILILSLIILMALSSAAFADLTDIANHWAKNDIEALIQVGAVNGYVDNTFKPDRTISRGEFTKIIVSMTVDSVASATGHWANGYYQTAQDEGYLPKGLFDDLDKPITRAEIALMISNAGSSLTAYGKAYGTALTDVSTAGMLYQDAILKVYGSGIISGYPDGSFKPNAPATRAEAATLLMRMKDTKRRASRTPVFNADSLIYFDGKDGRPALVAVNGTVYDVSSIPQWANGSHFSGVTAGKDQTDRISESPHGLKVLGDLPIVGDYK